MSIRFSIARAFKVCQAVFVILLLILGHSPAQAQADGGPANPTAPVWTWIGGSEGKADTIPTSFGTQGFPSSSNFPGSQSEATTWTDASGNLWLFGGTQSDSSGTYGAGNDLWRYNPSTSQWTWMGGGTIDVTGVAEGNYGTLGVAAAGNLPPGRLGGVGWTDASGNFWLFGGTAYADISSHYETQYYNDLWKYSTASNQWTWMGGSDIPTVSGFDSGVFGTKGTPSTANIPSSRYGSASWTDQSGNLWLMGGSGVDSTGTTAMLNDLWRYSPSSGQWTWMTGNSIVGINNGLSGTTSGVYGSQGVASDGNTPGGRLQGASWIDASGNFWLFGGWGSDSTGTTGLLNDLWEYSPSANAWTWVSGGTTLPTNTSGLFEAPAGVYGTQGTASASNVPGGRYIFAAWTDASGNFWLFGGVGADSTDTDGLLNDVWVYSPSANTWTWMGGSTTANATAVYGTEGVASASNTPGSRAQMLYWTDASHNLWLFGGGGGSYQDGDPNAFTYYDLWTTGTAGGASSPAVTLSPSSLSFSSPSGTAAVPQTVTLTNSGNADLTGIAFGFSNNLGGFSAQSTCPSTLSAGDSCTFTIGFTPPGIVTYTNALLITDNAPNSPQSVGLTGTGTGTLSAAATIYPTSLTFNPTLVNTTNTGLSITFDNSGGVPLTGITPSIIGTNASDFAISSNTCSSLALGAACTISVTFTPPSTGTFNATLSIADNAVDSPQSVPLSGTGAAALETASITPTFLAFADQTINTSSDSVTVTLANPGATALTGISPAITGAGSSAFAVAATSCGTSIAVGASCSISVTFTPSSAATFNATLTVTDDASNPPQVVPLSGSGVAASSTSAATLSTTSLTFPNTAIGASSPLSVTVTNSGTQPLSIDGIVFGGAFGIESNPFSATGSAFTQTSNCGATLAVGESCVITVTFTPAAGSLYSGTLLIADSSSSLAQSVSLTGVGSGGSGTSAALTPSLGFGAVALSTTSAAMTATLTNTGSVALTGITPSLSSNSVAAGFAISSTTCGSSLAPGATCTISLTYTSIAAGQYGGILNVADSAPGSPQSINLAGSSDCPTTADTTCNPGGGTVSSATYVSALAFNPATVTTVTATAASTEIVGRYQGAVVYDQTFPAAYGSPSVQAGVTAANAAIVAAGGSGAVIPAPALTSTSTNTSTSSASVYSSDPAAPVATTETAVTYGPATIRAAGDSNYVSPNPTVGQLTECIVASLPSSTIPTCYATDPGLFQVLAGQEDINQKITRTYFIDTATTTTTTTTTTAAYAIDATAASAAALTVMPAGPLSFSATSGTTSSPQMVTLTNSGTGSLTIIGISLTGANASSFAETNNCPASLPANASCTISITFTPAAATSYSASLSITDNATGSPQTVTLTGTGTTPACVNNPATPYVNCNPGGAVVGSNSQSQQLTFATPVVTTATASAFSTEIVGTYNGTTVYDQTFAAAYGTPTVEAGVTAANAAIATAGGSNAVIPAPALTSTSSNTSTSSSSIYSVAQPEASTTVITSTTTTTFGPATIMAQVANLGNPANPTAGQTSTCNVASLPSATMPTCMATNAGTLTVAGGQEDINTNIDNNYLINTATTSTTTTTTDAVYSINATAATSAPNPDDLDWTWMGGLNLIGTTDVAPGSYGTLGVPASTNLPLGRVDPGTWTDKSGNFWMMGGSSISQSVGIAFLNDLWEYSSTTLKWTWQSGANSEPAGPYGVGDTFGTQGTPSAQSVPGARAGSLTWSDPSGNLWLYGGYGVNDGLLSPTPDQIAPLYSFWKYTPSLGQWTWIAGTDYSVSADVVNSIPTYGVMGTPSSTNFPGARSGGSTWTDSAGNLWMFGGDVVDNLTYYSDGFLESAIDGNDLWKFDPTSQQWTWEAGLQITSSASVNPNCTPGVNGTLGQAAPGITPSGRGGSSSWTDSAGNFWLFGGQGCGSFNVNAGGNNDTWGPLNDLWKFNTTTNQWTWVAGGTDADQSGVYGTLGTPSAGNTPGAREDAYSWTDKNGKFWLFGGSGYDSNGNYGSFNDLWMFDPSTTEWTWEGGSTTDSGSASLPGIYGTLGVGAAGNMPGARDGGGAWTDTSGNLWLFGGLGEDASGTLGDLNDLWEYGTGALVTPQTATPAFSVAGGNYSSAQSVTISDATPNATIYYTIDGTTPTTGSTVYSGTAIAVSSTETIEAIATASGYTQSATATVTYTITAQAKTTPTVTVSPSPASVTTAQALSVTITVSGTPTPTGTVTLTSGTYTSGSVTLSNGSVTISIPAGALTTGTDTLTATYTPDANSSSTFTSATGTNTVTVTAAVVTAPAASLTPPGPLTFTAVSGSTSAAQTETLSNTGNATLSIASIGITGTNASAFAETNTCGSSLAANSSCTISIAFSPSAAASFTANLSVADNASGSPQTITLNGTGTTSTTPAATFTLSSLISTGTVSPTTTATYSLTVTPQNGSFTSPILLTASGVPTGYMATFNPASVTPGSSPATATLTISKSPIALLERTLPITAPALALIAFFFVPRARRRRLIMLVVFVVGAIAAVTFSGCGGGFGLPTTTYNVTIAASGGGVTQTTTVQLTVRQ